MEKVAKKIDKKWFDVRIECTLPATITYKVLADSAEEAIDLIKNQAPVHVKYNVLKRKNIKATIYDSGTNLMRFIKRFI